MQKELNQLYSEIAGCTRCHLGLERINTVRDKSDPERARVILVGEAPGANEIKYGVPFAGEAGKKLSTYLSLAGLTREEVYITNVVRCRPTANGGKRNRTPTREIPLCGSWLNRELEIIRPLLVVTLGNISLKWLCGKSFTIGSCHGRLLPANNMRILPMYHPAAAIYRKELDALIRSEFEALGKNIIEAGR
jgi:DNA polymerase